VPDVATVLAGFGCVGGAAVCEGAASGAAAFPCWRCTTAGEDGPCLLSFVLGHQVHLALSSLSGATIGLV
jgi:hypothetical protein